MHFTLDWKDDEWILGCPIFRHTQSHNPLASLWYAQTCQLAKEMHRPPKSQSFPIRGSSGRCSSLLHGSNYTVFLATKSDDAAILKLELKFGVECWYL